MTPLPRPAARRVMRWALALTLLAICSCRGTRSAFLRPYRAEQIADCPAGGPDAAANAGILAGPAPPSPAPLSLAGMPAPQTPLPQMLVTPWAPPGIALPWPADEYLADGGDKEVPVTVNRDGQVNGLELEDTVVHFDTLDGHTLVEPSNRVNIYAPRFAAVRSVEETRLSERRDQISEALQPVGPYEELENKLAGMAVQPLQPVGEIGVDQPSLARRKQGEGVLLTREIPYSVQSPIKAFEDFEVIRLGTFDENEQARLIESIDAAIAWSHDQALQVVIDNEQAHVYASDERAEATYRVDLPTNPRLRVIKVASTQQARPGDLVDFTIRYDNVGDAAIGNVTLIDNLTTRLEYVEGSAKSSREGHFFADSNQGDSLALRWEFDEPLDPGQGGLVRFQCRVR